MATRSSKFLKLFNRIFYIASIAMLAAGMMLTLAVKPTLAANGTIWTTDSSCGVQDKNQYYETESIYFNYNNIDTGDYTWTLDRVSNPSGNVASGTLHFTSSSSSTCVYVYTFGYGAAGEYKLQLNDPNGKKVKSDNLKVITLPNPALSINKSVTSSGPYALGATVSYNIVVTNTGNVALTGVTVTDPGAATLSCPSTSLAVGASMTCTATHIVTQGNIDAGSYTNTATADSNQTGPSTSSATVTFTQSPGLDVTKTQTSSGPYAVGQTITYSIGVTNTGNVTLNNVTVTDISAVVGACTPANGSSLAPAATMTCAATHVVTQADVDSGVYNNTATGTSGSLSDSASVRVTFAQNPALDISKTVTSTGPYIAGSTITYQIVVTNIGNITLHNVDVSDTAAVLGSCTPSEPAASLAPGATITCSASHIITQAEFDSGSYTNIAYANSNETGQVNDDAVVNFTAGPAMSIDKSMTSTGPYIVGDEITYSIEVTNTGNVTLTNVTVSDSSAVLGACTPAQPATLAPNASMTCSATHIVTQTDVNAGEYTNTATGRSNQTDPVTDSVTVNFVPSPSIDVVKTVTPGTYEVGDTIPYTITATNTGNVTLTNVTINDPKVVFDSCDPVQGSSLAPNASMTCSVSHLATQADVDAGSYTNTATGQGYFGTTPYSDTDSVTVPFTQSPNMSITKAVTSTGPYDVNGLIVYSIVLTNTGNITLHNVMITDANAVLGTCTIDANPAAVSLPVTLAPSSVLTCSAGHTVSQGDFDSGIYTNTAIGTSNETTPKDASASVSFVLGPALAIDKQETSTGPYVVDDTISYSFTVSNIGNVTLHNVTVSDPGAVIDSCTPATPATLAPAGIITCTGTHVVTAADITAGLLLPTFVYPNTATASSTETQDVTDSVQAPLGIEGCTDPAALNYDPTATIDDGSCVYPEPISILDPYCGSGEFANTMEWVVANPNADPFTVDYWTLDGNLQSGFIAPVGTAIFAHTSLGTHTVVLYWGETGQTSLTFTINSCSTPPVVTPTPGPTVQPLPTLPIPATGGQSPVLIPVTGADLSGNFAARMIRGLIYGSFTCFGLGLVLTGLRRKYHL